MFTFYGARREKDEYSKYLGSFSVEKCNFIRNVFTVSTYLFVKDYLYLCNMAKLSISSESFYFIIIFLIMRKGKT